MEYRVVAKVVVVNTDGAVLLLRRSASDTRRPSEWDIPGGHAEDAEFADEAAIRETAEEAGVLLDARQLRLAYSTCHFFDDDTVNVVWLFFIARADSNEVRLSDEHDAYQWTSLDEASNMITYDRQQQMFAYLKEHRLLED